MENVLITGGAGFIGSHVGDLLIKKGYNVFVVDNLSSGNTDNLNKKVVKFYDLDINSPDIEKVFKDNKIDYVFHFAAQASVSFSTKNPTEDAIENILGSINILKYAKKYGVKKFIVSSTAAVYGVPEYLPVDEKHKTTCLSFYGVSKLTMEKYVALFGLDYIIFRFANVYGPRQSAHGEAGVVAIFAEKMKNNEDIRIDGDGEQTRDFVYVSDIAEICLRAIKSNFKNEIINISTNKVISINKLFELMASKFEYTKQPVYVEERLGDIKHSVLDNNKCEKFLNFKPQMPIEKGLDYLIDSVMKLKFIQKTKKHIEVTTNIGCKNNCVYCPQSVLLENYYKDNKDRKSMMTLDDFKVAISHVPNEFLIVLGGMSEPFENKETVDMILYANEQKRPIRVTTSLRGLSIGDINRMKDVIFDSWFVHIPDADGIMNQEVTIDYIEKLKLIDSLNIKEVSYLGMGTPHKLIKDILGDKLKLEKIVLRGNNLDKSKMPQNIKFKRQSFTKLDSNVQIVCGKSLDYPNVTGQKVEIPILLPDGTLLLCCNDYAMDHVLGNLYENSYINIKHGGAMKKIKASMMCKNDDKLLCRNCEWALDYSDKTWQNKLSEQYFGKFSFYKKYINLKKKVLKLLK